MQKTICKLLLLVFLLWNTNIQIIYASVQSEKAQIEQTREKTEKFLEKVEKVLEKATDKMEDVIKDEELQEKLEEKKEEIKETLEEAQEQIQKEKSTKNINKIAQDTRKKVVLKAVSSLSKDAKLSSWIDEEIAPSLREKKQAYDTLKNSLKQEKNYTLIVETNKNKNQVKSIFEKFEEKTKINYLYNNWKQKYYEVTLPEDWIFVEEILWQIEIWKIPENFLNIKIVKPEIYSINQTSSLAQSEQTSPLAPLLRGEGDIWRVLEKDEEFLKRNKEIQNKLVWKIWKKHGV